MIIFVISSACCINEVDGLLSKFRVTPLAAESFGVRSMCTLVETPDTAVLLDAGISLCPMRSGFPPHPIEFQTIAQLRKQIAQAAEKAQVVTISHYHFDHHTPSYEDWLVNWTKADETARQIYSGKYVLVKNPKVNINASQRQRAWMFQKTGGKCAKRLEAADGKSFRLSSGTELRFSEAVFHGSGDSGLGWVIIATVEFGGERFVFAPDVQGPMVSCTAELILAEKPQLLMVGGPPFHLGGSRVDEACLEVAVENLRRMVECVPTTILEHHALRDPQWRLRCEPIFSAAARANHRIVTAAEFMGKENQFLESRRAELYALQPPSEDFRRWMRLSGVDQSSTKPPIN